FVTRLSLSGVVTSLNSSKSVTVNDVPLDKYITSFCGDVLGREQIWKFQFMTVWLYCFGSMNLTFFKEFGPPEKSNSPDELSHVVVSTAFNPSTQKTGQVDLCIQVQLVLQRLGLPVLISVLQLKHSILRKYNHCGNIDRDSLTWVHRESVKVLHFSQVPYYREIPTSAEFYMPTTGLMQTLLGGILGLHICSFDSAKKPLFS
ncbi:hypothetical protein STEG23_000027, partial [Scotinomys teguina]